MRLLLDTHIFLWFVEGKPQISARARQLIEDASNDKFLSIVSAWEIAIKVSIGKLTLAQPVDIYLPNQMGSNGIVLLPVDLSHVFRVAMLPFHHRDPFDRILVAQSLLESMPLVSADPIFDAYGVQRLW